MRDYAELVQEAPESQPQPYGEVALGVECAWPQSIPGLGQAVEALSQATLSIRFQL